MTSEAYCELSDAEKYMHWKAYKPSDPYMATVRRRAMRQFKAAMMTAEEGK